MVENFKMILPYGTMFFIIIGSFIGIKMSLKDRPTFKNTNETYQKKESCDLIHKSVKEKLDCIPSIKKSVIQIETKIDILLKNNGK